MRYKWIELINYAGFYNGMGLNHIKIDFTLCKTNKIVIRGCNGSGKSTLINSISALPDTNDKFIPGLESRKNICISDINGEYVIRYIHPVLSDGSRGTTKGYVSKMINGQYVELNPNGNISSCKDIVYSELGLDTNFLALSQLSSEDKGLVEKKPAERKRFVTNIIDVLEVYNNIYKILNKKSSVYKTTINSLTYKIDSIGDETTVNLKLKSVEDQIFALEEAKNKIIESIASNRVLIKQKKDLLEKNNYNELVSNINDLEGGNKRLYSKISSSLDKFELGIDDVDDARNSLNDTIISLQTTVDINKRNIPIMLGERESECAKLQDKSLKLETLKSDYSYNEIKGAMDKAKQTVTQYELLFNEMKLKNIDLITKDEFELGMKTIEQLKEQAEDIYFNISLDNARIVITDEEYAKNLISTRYPNAKQELVESSARLRDVELQLNTFEIKREVAKALDKRPKNCTIDTCLYIKNAVEADKLYPQSEYEKLLNEKAYLDNSVEKLNAEIENIESIMAAMQKISYLKRELLSKANIIKKLPLRPDFIDTFFVRVLNHDSFKDIDAVYKYVDCGNAIEEYKSAKNLLIAYQSKYDSYNTNFKIVESIVADVNELTEKTNNMAKEIDKLNGEIAKDEDLIEKYKLVQSKLDALSNDIREYREANNHISELKGIRDDLYTITKAIDSMEQKIVGYENDLNKINKEININTGVRDTLKHSVQLLTEYKKELNDYNTKYTKIEKIKYYSSPSKGIQTVFMEMYMNRIISTANNLLSLLFSGEFMLQRFIINDNEFRIPCSGSGLMHDDISSMSTAQKSMISLILSFSLLHESSSRYNVIKLDEIDGGLDTVNRQYFITLLDKLMMMLNCEQCFIVSHNNELDTSLCDLIVLKGEGNVNYSGNIIWKY